MSLTPVPGREPRAECAAMATTYRTARPEDAAACLALRGRTRQNAITPAQLAALGITETSWAEGIRSAALPGQVCLQDAEIVGYCFGSRDSGEVLVLALLPSAEGQGIGRELLRGVVQHLGSLGWTRLFLRCSADPASRSHGFYHHLGWRSSGGAIDAHGDEALELLLSAHHHGNPTDD